MSTPSLQWGRSSDTESTHNECQEQDYYQRTGTSSNNNSLVQELFCSKDSKCYILDYL